ncbi:MAG TPA: acyl-CoA thioesterase II [Labilithrix sp.]|jgi:acyl-CoA thioesterase-2|nr:acyl-CoA thioesterase II [Labilithrix sp.]
MSHVLDDLVKQLALERIEENLFRGQSQDLGWGTVFGGQVLGQALSAAAQTVPSERHVHSLNAYFLRPGDVTKPIVYEVDRIRDGTSFTTRRVVAIQNGKAIFHLGTSFQKEEPGFEHQDPMPAVPPPEAAVSDRDRFAAIADRLPKFAVEQARAERPIELRFVDEIDLLNPTKRPARRLVWLRAAGKLPDDPALHAYLLAYASDFALVSTALLPHGVNWLTPGIQLASIDHAMWFHRPARIDDWLLYVMDSPAAHGARGLARGTFFTKDGVLVASTAQEGLMRRR